MATIVCETQDIKGDTWQITKNLYLRYFYYTERRKNIVIVKLKFKEGEWYWRANYDKAPDSIARPDKEWLKLSDVVLKSEQTVVKNLIDKYHDFLLEEQFFGE